MYYAIYTFLLTVCSSYSIFWDKKQVKTAFFFTFFFICPHMWPLFSRTSRTSQTSRISSTSRTPSTSKISEKPKHLKYNPIGHEPQVKKKTLRCFAEGISNSLEAFRLFLVLLAEGGSAEAADQQRRQRARKRLAAGERIAIAIEIVDIHIVVGVVQRRLEHELPVGLLRVIVIAVGLEQAHELLVSEGVIAFRMLRVIDGDVVTARVILGVALVEIANPVAR